MNEVDKGCLLSEMPGMTLAIAKACVTGVAYNRPLDAIAFAYRRGVTLTEDSVFDIASQAQMELGLDLPRSTRGSCFLCGRDLPTHMERLCSCFLASMPGVWVDLSRKSIESLHAAKMGAHLAVTTECLKCSELQRYTIEDVYRILRQNPGYAEYRPHKHCRSCHPGRSNAPPRNKEKGTLGVKLSLQQLAAQVASEAVQPVA